METMNRADSSTTGLIIQGIIRVHQALGPGFVEAIYQRALCVELRLRGLAVELERTVVIRYEGVTVGRHRPDLIVDESVIVETKTVESLGKAHYAQVRSYLKATGLQLAILVNFSGPRADYRRVELPTTGSGQGGAASPSDEPDS